MTRKERIHACLQEGLSPVHLDVIDESHMHSVPKGAETHFKIVVASDAFEGKSLVNRQRAVNKLLQGELAGGLHALTMTTLTPGEWSQAPDVPSSPACRGGSKADRQAG